MSEQVGTNTINMSSTEPRRYIKRDRPRSIATTDAKVIAAVPNQTSASTSNLPDIANVISPIGKKVKIQLPKEEESNGVQNGDEWTEISLNNSPEEIYHNNEVYSDEEEQIPYKPLGADLSPETSNKKNDSNDNAKRKRLVSQKSLPAMTEQNEVSLSEEKKAQLTRSPSFKRKGKLDSCLATWISRNAVANEMSAGSSGE